MLELESHKRYTLAAALVRQQIAQCSDDLGEMLVKKLRRIHRQAHDEFQQALLAQQSLTEQLVGTFHQVLLVWHDPMADEQKLAAIGAVLGPKSRTLLEQCQAHAALTGHNYLPFLWSHFRAHRTAFFSLIEEVELVVPGSDKSLEQAIALLKRHRRSRQQWLIIDSGGVSLDPDLIPDRWWKLVTGYASRTANVTRVNHRYFELCVFTKLVEDLSSGDLVIGGSEKFSDYREQFVTDEEYRAAAPQYCEQAGLPAHRGSFVEQLREWLTTTAAVVEADPQNPNWWHNQIGTPKQLGETALFLGDDVPADALPQIINILKRSDWIKWTGQNLVWGCENQIVRGILARDSEVVRQAFARMYEEVRTGQPAGEGIMPDFSFHQHGSQFYSGGYGLNFASDVGAFIAFGWGTTFQVPPERMDIYTRYVLDGEAWMTRGNIFDYSATGREITRKGKVATPRAEKGISLTTIAAAYHLGEVVRMLSRLEVPRREEYAAFAARLEGRSDAPQLSGNRHYWCSDYMAHQRPQFFTSVRMFSSRLINTEIINDEGKRSHHLADGCTLVYRSGDEYRDIFPVWDWTKIPGTTAEQMELSTAAGGPRYKTDANFVGGVSDGTYGLAAQELHRESLRARKAWMMLDDGFVALGAGINCDSDRAVVTSVNQCLMRGQVDQRPGANFVWHDRVAYLFPAGQKFRVTHGAQTGRWSDIGVGSDKPVTEQVFSLWLDHGARPRDATYVFVVMPGMSASEASRAKNTVVEVLSNSPTLQAVSVPKLGLIGVVFWSAGRVESGRQTISADQPCLLMVQERGKRLRISVANPVNEALRVNVTVGRKVSGEDAVHTAAGTTIKFDLPGGPTAGSTVVKEFQTD